MKLSIAACVSALAVSGLSAGIDLGDAARHDVSQLDDGGNVPGENPFKFCDAKRDGDFVEVKSVTVDPNPVQLGATATVKANFDVKKAIERGAYINIIVKYGQINLMVTTVDLCEQASGVGLECPIEPGNHELSFDAETPSEVPPGTYTVYGDAYSYDVNPLTCMKTTVKVPRSGSFDVEL